MKSISLNLTNFVPYHLTTYTFKASMQNVVSILLDNRQLNIFRLYQSIIATKYKEPLAIGIYAISVAHTKLDLSISKFFNRYGYILWFFPRLTRIWFRCCGINVKLNHISSNPFTVNDIAFSL